MAKTKSVLLTDTINCVENCVEYFHINISRPQKQLIGIEHEFHMLDTVSGLPISESRPKDIQQCLNDLCQIYGYQPILEDRVIIGADNDGIVYSLEPGGQIEISTRPESNVACLDDQLNEAICNLEHVLKKYQVKLISTGYCPTSTPDRIVTIESKRYEVMMPLLKRIGQNTDAQKMTASIQVSTDYNSEEHAARSLLAGILLQPYVGALFANSPLVNGSLTEFCSYRMHTWRNFENSRAGVCGIFLEDSFLQNPFQSYTDWACNLPLLFIQRHGQMIPVVNKTFNEYLQHGHSGLSPTMSDWSLHLGTLFPYARLKNVVEFRAVDSCSSSHALALAAFWKGIIYDNEILETVTTDFMVRNRNVLSDLYEDAAMRGLDARGICGTPIANILTELIRYSKEGLLRMKMGEEIYLDLLTEMIATKAQPYSVYDLHSFLRGQNSTRNTV